jgi:tRNA-specific 2-thiouridylase
MGQHELAHTLMPVGAYSKDDIRQMALEADFPNAQKPDSQDICFIPLGDYKAFLKERGTPVPGDIVDLEGRVLGRHEGLEFFTIGQRRGLGIASGEPRYVVRLEPETNQVVVGPEPALYRDTFWASRVNYVSGSEPAGPVEVGVKIRYKFEEAAAVLRPGRDGALITFEKPQRSITPGQAAVFYQDDVVLGGGTIEGGLPRDLQ